MTIKSIDKGARVELSTNSGFKIVCDKATAIEQLIFFGLTKTKAEHLVFKADESQDYIVF